MRIIGSTRATRVAAAAVVAASLLGLTACSGDSAPTPGPTLPVDPPSTPAPNSGWKAPTEPSIVFRNTAPGDDFGKVSSVALSAPAGARTVSPLTCERVDASRRALSCLSRLDTDPVGYRATLYEADGSENVFWSLPGPPSRTRLSPNSQLAAWTGFVDGESYGGVAFSTQTIITQVHGTYYGPLDAFTFLVDAKPYAAPDLNFWGVTFADDGNTFYATAASAGRTWLARGNLRGRTLVAVREGAECPSLSPDGTRVAYKKNLGTADAPRWTLAVYDLGSKAETVLPLTGNVDDQAEWLDDQTLLFGLPVPGSDGDFNVYSAPADGSAAESLFLEHAWSPSVVR
ncbi:hypothetical protein [Leifsonia sp. NPDC077715]|uniref:hypothetical protein n=1 Tax=Leifsonia sp. NPDC077715 TaxID=3155539 RepID=UPI003428D789